MSARILIAVAAVIFPLTTGGAVAQLETRYSLEASVAQEMIAACESYAKERGGAANIWVLNLVGKPMGFERMDGANPWMDDWAHMKALTAIDTGAPSSSRIPQMERRGVTQGTGMYYQLDHFPRAGGVPVLVDDKPVGAIGVEGLGPEEDERCAEAGVAAVMHFFTE